MHSGYGHMVLDDYVVRVREMRAERAARLRGVTSRLQALAYQERVRSTIRAAFGPPCPRSPLNTQVNGVIERPGYRIEKVWVESQPGCPVTANLYIPSHLTGPAPAVLGACGHSANGKAYAGYQGFCQRLVKAGFVVLIYDPLNQGERDQYVYVEGREVVAECTRAHNMMGKQLELLGESLSTWFVWDGMRALDYLLSRPEVDPQCVGMTGNSGGGTQTTWLWPLEPRLKMAAPSCFVTTFLHNLENELPADCEQYPPGVLAAGLEMADFLIARAPDPLLMLGQHYDFFDRRGFQEACVEVQRFYELLGAQSANWGCFCGPHPHGFGRENQEAMVAFFARHAALKPNQHVEETEVLDDAALYVTPKGNVVEANSRPIYTWVAERAADLASHRPTLSPDALRARVAELLVLPAQRIVPHYRNLRPTRLGDATYGRCALETERDIRAILYKRMVHPEQAHALDVGQEVHLYLPHHASVEDLSHDPLALALQADHELYALDVRGLGESAPDEEGSFWQSYGLDYMFHGHGILFKESYLGRRTLDVLSTVDLLVTQGASEVHLYGRGQGALLALFAALLHPKVAKVTLKNGPRTYLDWAQTPLVDWPAANFLRGCLRYFDLDDCIRALGNKVTTMEPWDAHMRPAL